MSARGKWPEDVAATAVPDGKAESVTPALCIIQDPTPECEMLKRRAAKEGLPYQSLIAGILLKQVSRSAPETN
ncbi:MAG: hypothetical protein LV473_13715 [Nitrospira sp.]|nr:hypothetical protein [Nitrospira sp.]